MYGVDYIALVSCIYYAFHHMKSCKLFAAIENNSMQQSKRRMRNVLHFLYLGLTVVQMIRFVLKKPWQISWKTAKYLLVLDFLLTFCQHVYSLHFQLIISIPHTECPIQNQTEIIGFNYNKMDPLKIFLKAWFNQNS